MEKWVPPWAPGWMPTKLTPSVVPGRAMAVQVTPRSGVRNTPHSRLPPTSSCALRLWGLVRAGPARLTV